LGVPLKTRAGERLGVFELINKLSGSFTADDEDALVELAAHAGVALENVQDRQRLLATNRQLADLAAEGVQLIGQCPAIQSLKKVIQRVAETDLAVLVGGENGTGKEVVAQSVHYLSRRRGQPLVVLNCAAIPETLAESELFGHEKGAFTDAREARPGKFELASGGTLFLDEIGDMPLDLQGKLLRVLEDGQVWPIGGRQSRKVDVRILAATNADLAERMRAGAFRQDVYYRLARFTVTAPPLRQRVEDIPLLALHFLGLFAREMGHEQPPMAPEALQRLTSYPYPGNVRELKNIIERALIESRGNPIAVEHLHFPVMPEAPSPQAAQPAIGEEVPLNLEQAERWLIQRALDCAGGNVSEAARLLGTNRTRIYRTLGQQT
jgi:Nif-specific regulatory protein